MNCRKAEALLADRALGFLSAGQERSLMEHVVKCEHCQKQAAQYRVVTQVLQTTVSERMAFNLADRVLGHARTEKQKGWYTMKWLMPAALGAAALLVIGVMPMFFSTPPSSSSMTKQEVLKAYTEDLEYFGISTTMQSDTVEFSYETYGVPSTVAQYMN